MEYLDPTYLISTIADYREYCHDINATGGFRSARSSEARQNFGRWLCPPHFRQPPDHLLSARASCIRASDHNLGWFAVWQYYGFGESYYAYENFQNQSVHHRFEVLKMKPTNIAWPFGLAVALHGATIPDMDSNRGRDVFESRRLHSVPCVKWTRAKTGPDLAKIVDRGFSPAMLAGTM